MKFGAIIAGLIFLFNPNVNLIDVLPDAIGFGLILYGITPFSHIQMRVQDAAKSLRMLTIIELIKLGSLYFYSFLRRLRSSSPVRLFPVCLAGLRISVANENSRVCLKRSK